MGLLRSAIRGLKQRVFRVGYQDAKLTQFQRMLRCDKGARLIHVDNFQSNYSRKTADFGNNTACWMPASYVSRVRYMTTDLARMPEIADPSLSKALNHLLAINWLGLDKETEKLVESALSKGQNEPGYDAVLNTWRAALAVHKFCAVLTSLRMELDELNGTRGEDVGPIPETLEKALLAAYQRYKAYLKAFGNDEWYLKKKVEAEIGGVLLQIKQRCSGLGAEWGDISLLGTSGISGSFIEHRAAA